MEEAITAKRPRFLTVLCMLTFIGSGISMLGSVGVFFVLHSIASKIIEPANIHIAQSNEPLQEHPIVLNPWHIFFNNWAIVLLVSGIICALLCLWGASKMWKLQREGFFIYLAGQLLSLCILSGMLVHGYFTLNVPQVRKMTISVTGVPGFFAMYEILSVFISLIFIVMYLITLKRMNRIIADET